jgi:ssDNA-binding Zn-finger/Zn-ribbon topoisomerase 1
MYTVLSLLILFLIAVFSVLLFFKLKNSRKTDLANGKCPACGESFKTFKDENTGTVFRTDVIKSRLLKNHGCSGTMEVEYRCSNCGLKEVHTVTHQNNCGI